MTTETFPVDESNDPSGVTNDISMGGERAGLVTLTIQDSDWLVPMDTLSDELIVSPLKAEK